MDEGFSCDDLMVDPIPWSTVEIHVSIDPRKLWCDDTFPRLYLTIYYLPTRVE
jgi:hypothetical protein